MHVIDQIVVTPTVVCQGPVCRFGKHLCQDRGR